MIKKKTFHGRIIRSSPYKEILRHKRTSMNRGAYNAWQCCSAWGAVLDCRELFSVCMLHKSYIFYTVTRLSLETPEVAEVHCYVPDVWLLYRLHLTQIFVLLPPGLSATVTEDGAMLTHARPRTPEIECTSLLLRGKTQMHVRSEWNLSGSTSQLLSSYWITH